jgi:sporulation protein YlmC with PRC-barrel domain
MAKNTKRLQELRGSDFEVAKGQPDIRGWEVRDNLGHLIGKVSELIFDSRAHKVRYMVVNIVDSKELQLDKRTVLVPIGLAVLEHKNDDVILESITPFQLRALPRYSIEDLGTRSERAISEVFGRKDNKGVSTDADEDLGEDFYEHDQFNEENMNRPRSKPSSIIMDDGMPPPSRSTLSESDANFLRHEEEKRAVANASSDNTSIRDNEGPQLKGETDEEYIRRARKNLDNRK